MKKKEIVELWLDAEEENRKYTEESTSKCLELKQKFSEKYDNLSLKDKQYVKEELDSLGA